MVLTTLGLEDFYNMSGLSSRVYYDTLSPNSAGLLSPLGVLRTNVETDGSHHSKRLRFPTMPSYIIGLEHSLEGRSVGLIDALKLQLGEDKFKKRNGIDTDPSLSLVLEAAIKSAFRYSSKDFRYLVHVAVDEGPRGHVITIEPQLEAKRVKYKQPKLSCAKNSPLLVGHSKKDETIYILYQNVMLWGKMPI